MQIPWRGRFSEWKIQHGTLHRRKAFNRYSNAFDPLSAEDGHLPWPRSGCKKRLPKQKWEKLMKTMGFKNTKEFVVAKSDSTFVSQIGRNSSFVIHCCTIRIHNETWWVNDQVKQSNVKTSPTAAFVDSSSLDDVRLRAITYEGGSSSSIQRIWNGIEIWNQSTVMQSLFVVAVSEYTANFPYYESILRILSRYHKNICHL